MEQTRLADRGLVGNLGKDPVMRETKTGRPVVSFSLATTVNSVANGIIVKNTEWHNIIAWNTNALAVSSVLKKGDKVLVVGSEKERSFVGKDGTDKKTVEFTAQEVWLPIDRLAIVAVKPAQEETSDDDLFF